MRSVESKQPPAGARAPRAPRAAAPPSNPWLIPTICGLLALAVWAVFGQTLGFDFVNYDDRAYIYENPAVTHGLSLKGVVWAFTHVGDHEWFPLTWISRMADLQLYGLDASGHHATNVLLHTATVILLFLLLRKMTGRLWPSAFVAAVFAVHPLRVESVAWVTERKDVLSGLFFMLTLWAYARYAKAKSLESKVQGLESAARGPQATGNASRVTFHVSPFFLLTLLFFTLGLLAKTMLVTLPFVLLLLDYWPLGRIRAARCGVPVLRSTTAEGGRNEETPEPGPSNTDQATRNTEHASRLTFHVSSFSASTFRLVAEKLPLFALSAVACVVTILTQPHTVQFVVGHSWAWRIGNSAMAYADYLARMVYPVGLAVGYDPPPAHLPGWRIMTSLAVLVAVSAGVVASRRKRPYLLVGWLWYLGMLVPVIDYMQAGMNARADRFTYLPQIGLYIMIAWGAADLCRRWRCPTAVTAGTAALAVAGMMATSYVQCGYWRNSFTLWSRAIACTPDNAKAHLNLGIQLGDQERLEEAVRQFDLAVKLNPTYAKAYNNCGISLMRLGRVSEAIQRFQRAVAIDPDFASAQMNLGRALAQHGDYAQAVPHLEAALKEAIAETNAPLAEVLRQQISLCQGKR